MEAAVTWMVVWGLIGLLTPGLVGTLLVAVAGAFLVDSSTTTLAAVAAFISCWVIAFAWFIFCVIQFINNLITVIELA